MTSTDNGIIPPKNYCRLILASGSPRRKEILKAAGFDFIQVVPHTDESQRTGETPAAYVMRLALEKAQEGIRAYGLIPRIGAAHYVALGADTTVVCDNEILNKPADPDEACRHLAKLSGRTHHVLTGYALVDQSGKLIGMGVAQSGVTMAPLSRAQIEEYVLTGEPMDKAGAYAAQGQFARHLTQIDGLLTNVIGLPIEEIMPWLQKAGITRHD